MITRAVARPAIGAPGRRRRRFLALAGLTTRAALCLAAPASLLAACSTQRPLPKADESQVRQLTALGYTPSSRGDFNKTSVGWDSSAGAVELLLRMPSASASVPLVLYFPAMGETRAAGGAWCDTWANAGYAVLSVQLLADDADAWSSPAAHNGDFTALGRERYSAKVMTRRQQVLRDLLADLSRRRDLGAAPWSQLDLTRVALAGYDLGAYTATVAAGELPAGAVAGLIALSPYPDSRGSATASGQAGQRYSGLRLPVLSVTSDEDTDPLGMLSSVGDRRLPFDAMPPGNKYLLMLSQIAHMALGGPTIEQLMVGNSGSSDEDAGAARSRSQGSGSRRRGSSVDSLPIRPQILGGVPLSPTTQALGIATVQAVSTAFLDAYLKRDSRASQWLQHDAAGWIGTRGQLAVR